MNIMIINHYAGSEQYGMEFRPFYMGSELVKLGHDVTVIAADCSHLRIENPKVQNSFEEKYIGGVRYLFVKTVKYKRNNHMRLFNVMSFLTKVKLRAARLYNKYKPDVVIASSTYPHDFKAAQAIARHSKACHGKKVKVCFEVHDIWPLSLIELYKISKDNIGMKLLQREACYAYKNADKIISMLPHVNRHIAELGFANIDYSYIPNGIIFDESIQKLPPSEILDAINVIKVQGKKILMYLGGFSKANALDDLIEAAKFLDKNIQIVMVGSGPLKAEYEKMIADKGISNVTILCPVQKTQVNKTLALADMLYIGAKRTNIYKYGVGMNKIYDYMLSCTPIIYAIESSNDLISDAACGVTIEPENPTAIAAAAKKLAEMSQSELETLGGNGYNYVIKNHNYETLAKTYAKVLLEEGNYAD